MPRNYIPIKKREASSQTLWNQYIRATKIYGYFELKEAQKHSLPFSRIEPHQWDGLIAMQENGLVWKLSDEDSRQKPCDCISTPPMTSYLVIRFSGVFYMLPMKEVIKIRDEGIISITEEKSKTIAAKIVKLST